MTSTSDHLHAGKSLRTGYGKSPLCIAHLLLDGMVVRAPSRTYAAVWYCRANAFMRASKLLHFCVVGYPPLCRYNAMPVVAQLGSCRTGVGCHRSICVHPEIPTHGLVVRARRCAVVPAAASGAYSRRALLWGIVCEQSPVRRSDTSSGVFVATPRMLCAGRALQFCGDSYLRHRASACMRATRCAFVLAGSRTPASPSK